VKIGAGTIPVT